MVTPGSAYAHVRPSPRAVRAAVAVLAVLVTFLGLAAPDAGAVDGRPSASPSRVSRGPLGTGTVSGHIDAPAGARHLTVFVRNHRAQRNAFVGPDGNYRVSGLPDGTYHVIFNRLSGPAVAAAQFYDGKDEYRGSQSADEIVISAGAVLTGINATLHQGGSLDGVLKNIAGTPLVRCAVQAFTTDGRLVTRSGSTAADGSFHIGGLTTGDYLVRVLGDSRSYRRNDHCDNGTQFVTTGSGGPLGGFAQAKPVHIKQGKTLSLRSSLRYAPAGQISGHVTLPANALDSDRYVVARNRHHVQATRIDQNGDYTISHLATGTYRVTFDRLSGMSEAAPLFYRHAFEAQNASGGIPSSYDRVSVTAAQTTTLDPATLARGGRITGKVVDTTGAGLEHCYVQAFTTDNALVTRTAFTAADGSFSVDGLSTGRYLVRVLPRRTGGCNNHKQFYVGTHHLGGRAGAVPVRATRGKTTQVGSLAFVRGADISGHIGVGPGASQYDRAVTVRNGHWARTVYANGHGDYLVRGLAAGSYRVTFNRLSGFAQDAAQFYFGHDESQTVASADRITLAQGQMVTGIDARLHAGGHLTGRLVDASGNPLNCELQAFTTDGSLVTRDGYSYGDGTFDIGGLTTGNYYLRVTPYPYPGRQPCDQGIQYLGTTTTLSNVGPGSTRAVKQGRSRSVGTLVYGPRTAVVSTSPPTISGATTVGSVLTADPGTFTPAPTSYLYAWFSAGTQVPGATASTYQLQDSDLGNPITVRVTARRPGLTSASATSSPVGPVTSPTLTQTTRPTISGTPAVGSTLTVTPGTVTPTAKRVHYQWLRGDTPIAGARGQHYTATSADQGHPLSAQVTYSRPGYADLVATTKRVRVR